MLNTKDLRQLRKNGAYDVRKELDAGMGLGICAGVAAMILIIFILMKVLS